MNTLRKYYSISIALALMLVLQSVSPWVIFKTQQWVIKSEVKERIKNGVPDEALVAITFSNQWLVSEPTEIEWEHEKEFRFKDEWYDIVRTQDQGDSTTFLCIKDNEEDELFANLEHLTFIRMTSKNETEHREVLLSWLSLEYLYQEKLSLHSPLSYQNPSNGFYGRTPCEGSLRLETPPPNAIG